MRGNNIAYFVLGAALAASGFYGVAVGDLLSFKAGDPIKSAEVNANFSTLKTAVAALEAPIPSARLADGAVTLPKLSVGGTAADGKVLKLSGGALAWADDLVGNGGNTYSADGSSLALSGTTFSIKDSGVSTAKLANGAVTGSKLSSVLAVAGDFPLTVQNPATSGTAVGLRGQAGGGAGLNVGGPIGLLGESAEGIGVLGGSVNSIGIDGRSQSFIGVRGRGGSGVSLSILTSMGVLGESATGIGVVGRSLSGTGVDGYSQSGIGVRGQSSANDAVVGVSTSSAHSGIVGVNQNGGFAAYFEAGSGGPVAVCSFKAGTTGWACSSDKNLKNNFQAVNPEAVLEAVAKMPITTWSMKGSRIRQMGPTAQDFHAAFGLGDSDKAINTSDAQGVAMAAIQGLYQENQELRSQIKALEGHLAVLEQRLPAYR